MSKELLGILCGVPNSSGLVCKTSQEEESAQTVKIITPCVFFLIIFYDPCVAVNIVLWAPLLAPFELLSFTLLL